MQRWRVRWGLVWVVSAENTRHDGLNWFLDVAHAAHTTHWQHLRASGHVDDLLKFKMSRRVRKKEHSNALKVVNMAFDVDVQLV